MLFNHRNIMTGFIIIILLVFGLSPSHGWMPVNGIGICTVANNQRNPHLISDGFEGAIIVWEDYRSTTLNPSQGADIYAQRIDKKGNFLWETNGVSVCSALGYQVSPRIISDGEGGAIFTWGDSRNGAKRDIYAQKINSTGSTVWTLNGVPVCTTALDQMSPRMTSDGAGGAFINWFDDANDLYGNIYVQHIDSTGHILWNPNGLAICTLSSDQYYTEIISDDTGGAIICWIDYRNHTYFEYWDIYAQRVNSIGSTLWTENGIAVSTARLNQYVQRLSSDGSNGVIIVWDDQRNSSGDIYVQRVNSMGSTLWLTDGICVSTTAAVFLQPIISDGSGGAIITWQSGDNIYAQRLDENGNLLWTLDGITICLEGNKQQYSAIASDNLGGGIITWIDYRENPLVSMASSDIYIQRVNSAGSTLWILDGIGICTAEGPQSSLEIISDSQNGAILVWEDPRNGNLDIYAQRIDGNGSISPPVSVPKEIWKLWD